MNTLRDSYIICSICGAYYWAQKVYPILQSTLWSILCSIVLTTYSFPPKKKRRGNLGNFVSLCFKLGTTRCAPMGSWNYFKMDNKEADMELFKVNSMRQETAQPQEPVQGQEPHLEGGNIWIHQSSTTSQRTSGWPVHHQQEDSTRYWL